MTTITPADADTKTCRDCGEVKPLDAFNRQKKAKDGRNSYCRECSRRRSREHRDKNRTRAAIEYPKAKLCSRCGQWGVVVLDPETGRPSTRLGSDWVAGTDRPDGLQSWCRWCMPRRKDRRARQLRTCPDCDDREPRPLTNFGRVPHGDGTESYSEFCRLHHMARGGAKRCGQCGAWKPATAYNGSAGKPDGLDSWCRDCAGEYKAAHYVENREHYAAHHAAYRAENREAIAAQQAVYRRTDRGRAVVTAAGHRRRAREYLADCGCVDGPALEAVKQLNNGRCVYCPNPADTVEHLAALSNGDGLNCVSALVPACGSCNYARNNRPMREFAESRGVNIDDLWNMTMTCDRWGEGTVSTARTLSGRKVWPFESAVDPVAMRTHVAEMTAWAAEREAQADAIEKPTDPLDASPAASCGPHR